MAVIKMTDIVKCWRACGVTRLSYTSDRKYKFIQMFWKWLATNVKYIFVFTQRFCGSYYLGTQGGILVMFWVVVARVG